MKYLTLACALFLCFSCNQSIKKFEYTSANFDLIQLSEGVYSCIHKLGGKAICNVGIIDNGSETLIFDSFLSPKVAEELLTVVEGLGLSPITYVVNSHSHNDHIRGNQVFSDDVKIISTSKTAELIEESEPNDIAEEKEYAPQRFAFFDSLYQAFDGDTTSSEYEKILMWRPYYEILSESHTEVETRLPKVFVDNRQSFDGPDRRVQITSKGAGHTESDLVLYLPDDQIVFTGDLVFNECHPYMPNGSISGWLDWLGFLETLNIKVVVPGHGQNGSKELINSMIKYLNKMQRLAMKMQTDKLTVDNAHEVEIPDEYKTWWFDQFFVPNLIFSYQQLSEL